MFSQYPYHRRVTTPEAEAQPGEQQPQQPTKSGMIPVRFTPDIIATVRHLATQDGVTVSTWIRRLVDRELSSETHYISQADLDTLLAVATLYIEAFPEDEMMTLPGKLFLQDVEEVVARHGRRY